MTMLLTKDQEYFEREFPGAAAFLRAARLRKECYVLAMDKHINEWGRQRLQELLGTLACSEPWFMADLRGDCGVDLLELLQ